MTSSNFLTVTSPISAPSCVTSCCAYASRRDIDYNLFIANCMVLNDKSIFERFAYGCTWSKFLNLWIYTAYFLNLGTYCILFRLNKTTDGLVDIQNAIKLKDQINTTFCILATNDHFNGDKNNGTCTLWFNVSKSSQLSIDKLKYTGDHYVLKARFDPVIFKCYYMSCACYMYITLLVFSATIKNFKNLDIQFSMKRHDFFHVVIAQYHVV